MTLRQLLRVLPALWITACSSVSIHGVVRDSNGRPIEKASVAARDGPSRTLASTTSDANGCFHLYPSVRRDEPRFVLEVSAPDEKAVSITLERKERAPILVTLADRHDSRESTARATTPLEQETLYDQPCAPIALPGATGLAPR